MYFEVLICSYTIHVYVIRLGRRRSNAGISAEESTDKTHVTVNEIKKQLTNYVLTNMYTRCIYKGHINLSISRKLCRGSSWTYLIVPSSS